MNNTKSNAKDIAEKIIKNEQLFASIGAKVNNDTLELASAYLELDIDLRKAYVDESIKNDTLKSEITKLKAENERLNKYVISGYETVHKESLEEITRLIEENESIRTQLLAQCRMSHELADEKEKLKEETRTLEHEIFQYEIDIECLKEDNSTLSKYCGEVRVWQNRAEDLSEENTKLKEENESLKEIVEALSPKSEPVYLQQLSKHIHQTNVEAGWWTNLETGEPLERNVGELLCLVHSEVSEALEAYRKDLNDDKLPHRKGFEVELVDALIRIFDIAGKFRLDLDGALQDKLNYNARRADHKLEARGGQNGKKF